MSTRYLSSALKALAAGEFICNLRYPDEFEALEDPAGRLGAEQWLQGIGYRLAQLGEDGAYFMAHAILTAELRAQLREEMRAVRSRLQPVVSIMEAIRKTQGRAPRVHAGDMLYVTEIAEAARASSMLETQIMEMREVSGLKATDKLVTRIQRMLEELEREGYVHETNPTAGGYRITGRIEYLYQLIDYISIHAPQLAEDGLKDQIEQPDAQTALGLASPSDRPFGSVLNPSGETP
ncbi:condensin complex protein MksE [Delftia acidovorans]|uniref:condensin complex protein MksE n=1 Tax=Delftia acidovorans TaxID=80866 RepID=UPI000BD1BA5C|nr:hypothetical protein [Delftia acidovorans]SOE34081.1 hypothetical protein SAMN05216519_0025 [Delftia acidovorans]